MKHSPLHIPTDGVAVVIDGTASGTLSHCASVRVFARTPTACVCRGHGVVLLHASGSVAHDIDGTASVVIGTQSVSCEPLNIERKRTACVPASGIKRIVANHSKRIIARTQDTQRRLDHGACVWSSACVCVRNSEPLHALQYLHTFPA